jgi:hypothetical protein
MRTESHTPLEIVLQGLERGLRDQIAQVYRVYISDKPDTPGRLAAGIESAVNAYHMALDVAIKTVEPPGFDIMSGDPERVTTGRDYGTDDV